MSNEDMIAYIEAKLDALDATDNLLSEVLATLELPQNQSYPIAKLDEVLPRWKRKLDKIQATYGIALSSGPTSGDPSSSTSSKIT